MRDDTRSSKKVLSYLRDENAYTDQWFAARNNYKKDLFDELMLQVAEEEISYAVNNNGYRYYEKTKKFDQLSRFYRSDTNGEEFLILDPNIKLINQEYYDVKSITPSFDNSLIAISEDNNGRREYTIKIIDSELMTELDDLVENTTGTVIWTDNNEYILYLKKDPVTLISNSVYAHKIGQPSSTDILLYKEDDLEFNLSLSISKTKKYAFINIEATNLNEIRLIDINKPLADPILFMPRLENHLYFLEHHVDESFLVLSNKDAPNFKVLKSRRATFAAFSLAFARARAARSSSRRLATSARAPRPDTSSGASSSLALASRAPRVVVARADRRVAGIAARRSRARERASSCGRRARAVASIRHSAARHDARARDERDHVRRRATRVRRAAQLPHRIAARAVRAVRSRDANAGGDGSDAATRGGIRFRFRRRGRARPRGAGAVRGMRRRHAVSRGRDARAVRDVRRGERERANGDEGAARERDASVVGARRARRGAGARDAERRRRLGARDGVRAVRGVSGDAGVSGRVGVGAVLGVRRGDAVRGTRDAKHDGGGEFGEERAGRRPRDVDERQFSRRGESADGE